MEQCSDSENTPRTPRTTSNSTVPSTSPPSPSDEDRLTPEPAQVSVKVGLKYNIVVIGRRKGTKRLHHNDTLIEINVNSAFLLFILGRRSLWQPRPGLQGSCNCDELRPVQCHLETKELWDKFHELGTEMIITKTGR